MRHRVAGRKLGRTTSHREAMLRNLSTALFDKERITTTLAKAKELRPYAEKLVTISKRDSLHARRQLLSRIRDKKVVTKMFDTISARFAQRPGGYTRIIKLGPRRGDHAEMAIVELVEAETSSDDKAESTTKRKSKATKKAARGGTKAKSGSKTSNSKEAAGDKKKSTTRKRQSSRSGAAKTSRKGAAASSARASGGTKKDK